MTSVISLTVFILLVLAAVLGIILPIVRVVRRRSTTLWAVIWLEISVITSPLWISLLFVLIGYVDSLLYAWGWNLNTPINYIVLFVEFTPVIAFIVAAVLSFTGKPTRELKKPQPSA